MVLYPRNPHFSQKGLNACSDSWVVSLPASSRQPTRRLQHETASPWAPDLGSSPARLRPTHEQKEAQRRWGRVRSQAPDTQGPHTPPAREVRIGERPPHHPLQRGGRPGWNTQALIPDTRTRMALAAPAQPFEHTPAFLSGVDSACAASCVLSKGCALLLQAQLRPLPQECPPAPAPPTSGWIEPKRASRGTLKEEEDIKEHTGERRRPGEAGGATPQAQGSPGGAGPLLCGQCHRSGSRVGKRPSSPIPSLGGSQEPGDLLDSSVCPNSGSRI